MPVLKSWLSEKIVLEKFAHQFDKTIKLLPKSHWSMKALATILWYLSIILTFGKKPFDKKRFFENSATAIGNYHFYPDEWTGSDVRRVLPHEATHTKQLRYCGAYIHPLLGVPLGLFIYAFVLFPIKLAIGRALIELQAEKEALRYRLKNGEPVSSIRAKARYFAYMISSGFYFYSLPEKWSYRLFDRMAEKLIQEEERK